MNKKKLMTLLIASVAIYFVMKYLRDQNGNTTGNTSGNTAQQQQQQQPGT